MNTTDKALHPFEAAGMGTGPYSFTGIFDLGEATNPDSAANFGNFTGRIKDAPRLKAGMGTCACCGHAITIICVVRDGAGDLWGVGSDCVTKTTDRYLGEPAAIAIASRQRALRAAKARKRSEAARKRRMAEVLPDGRTRQQHADEQRELAMAQRREELAKREAREKEFADIIPDLLASKSGFLHEMACAIGGGPLTPRQAHCTAKHFHREGSDAHTVLVERLTQA